MKFLALLSLLMTMVACQQSSHEDIEHPDDYTERFYSGCAKPGEFLDVSKLPAIPPSFDKDVQ